MIQGAGKACRRRQEERPESRNQNCSHNAHGHSRYLLSHKPQARSRKCRPPLRLGLAILVPDLP
jgi:hypothetical protein